MAALPRVISPLAPLGVHEGVEVVLVSVEAWADEVVVRLRGLPSETTERLDAEFGDALETWHREGRQGSPPSQPAEQIFPEVTIADDLGTAYAPRGSSRGGSGTMFRADYVFTPGPPETADSLSVWAAGDDSVEARVRLSADT
jgi:hypothetical protein